MGYLQPSIIAALLLATGMVAANPEEHVVWTAPSAQKVFRDEPPPSENKPVLRLSAARGEREAAQVVIRPASDVQLVSARVTDLRTSDGQWLGAHTVTLYSVAYIRLPAHNRDYPDPLPPLQTPQSLKANQNQPLWVSIEVPRDAVPGLYRGSLELRLSDNRRMTVPIELRVWSFEMPVTPSTRTAFGLWGDGIARLHGASPDGLAYRRLLARYWEHLVSRRISPYSIPVDIFSRQAGRYLGDPRLTSFVIPYSDSEEELRRTVEHLRRNGWLEKGYFYVVDEPITREQYDRLIEVCSRIKRVDPSLKIVSPYYRNPDFDREKTPFDLLTGHINMWCPNTAFFHPLAIRKRQEAGEEAWWYVCCGPGKPFANFFVDMDGVAHRILFWQQKMFGVQGLLYWNTVWWHPASTQDPWDDIATVKDINPNVYGDGSLMYPGKRVGVDGPVTSIRLELICDGLEDYEYLNLYEKRFGHEETLKLIKELTQSLTEFVAHPQRLESVRERIATALDAKPIRR